MLDTRLKTLITLMSTKSYTKTAELLYITQPAVTHHIKSIEKQYNIALFSNSKTFKLSPSGQLIYDYAIKSQSQFLQLESALASKEFKQRRIAFAATKQVASGFLRPVMKNWLVKHPKDKISVSIDSKDDITAKLDAGSIDFAIVDFNFDRNKYDSILIGRDNLLPIASKNNPLSTKLKIRYEMLSEVNLLVDSVGTGMRSFLNSYFTSKNINMDNFFPIVEVNDPILQIDMIEANEGFGFINESIISNISKKGLAVLNINDFEMKYEFYMIWNKDSLMKAKYRKYAEDIVDLHDLGGTK